MNWVLQLGLFLADEHGRNVGQQMKQDLALVDDYGGRDSQQKETDFVFL